MTDSRTVRLAFDTLERLDELVGEEVALGVEDMSRDQRVAALLDVFENVREERDELADRLADVERQAINNRQRLEKLDGRVEELEASDDEPAFDDGRGGRGGRDDWTDTKLR
jgi:hypothetical protein